MSLIWFPRKSRLAKIRVCISRDRILTKPRNDSHRKWTPTELTKTHTGTQQRAAAGGLGAAYSMPPSRP